MAKNQYDSQQIEVLKGLEPVRKRPGMYIGSTGEAGLHHILWEIIDNGIDEASNGYANKIQIILHDDGSVSVEDNGRGIPTDIHKEHKKSGVELVFTQLHAGGKFNNDNYDYSGGLHGVGASVTNALSKWLNVEVYNEYVYTMRFESYFDKDKNKVLSGIPVKQLTRGNKTTKRGTFIQFMPDDLVFSTTEFDKDKIKNRLRDLAFLNSGLVIELTDLRNDSFDKETFCYEGGIKDYTVYINSEKNVLFQKPIYISGSHEDVKIELSMQYTDEYTPNIISFVNNIPTTEGGMHETGLKSALTKVFSEYYKQFKSKPTKQVKTKAKSAKQAKPQKDKTISFEGEDFREGLTAILSIKLKNAQFEGQTKSKLGNSEVKPIIDSFVNNKLTELTFDKNYTKIFDAIIEKAQKSANARMAARQAKELSRAKSGADQIKLVGKLSACSSRNAKLNEVFIVEGDSAGGSAKQGRDRHHQAILPLRGKPLNVEKKSIYEILKNDEIKSLITAIGGGVGEDFKIEDLKYDKVIILSDADQDGAHIRAILLTFFFRYMRELVLDGHVYIGMPPLYKVYKKDKIVYAYNDKELAEAITKVGKGYQLQRYKGLGEMNPEQLWDTTLNPQTRMLMQVKIEDAVMADKLVSTLMGDNIESRKAYISKNANFNRVDTFIKKAGNLND